MNKYQELTKEDFINRNMITRIELPHIKENISFDGDIAKFKYDITTIYAKKADEIFLKSLYDLYKGKADEVIVIDEVEFERFIKRFLPIYLEEKKEIGVGKMIKYIKKPVEIEAVKWNGNNGEEIVNFVGLVGYTNGENIIIPTLEGDMKASAGDYIIKGVNGEFYPCKPDIFEKTYDKTPTEEEIKKEWEALGYEIIRFERREIYLKKENTYFHITNFGRIEYSKYSNRISVPITFYEHQLAAKTFKLLEEKDVKN